MVRPLYPPRKKKKEKEPLPPLWKSPQIVGAGLITVGIVALFIYHSFSSSNVINPEGMPGGSSEGVFSFLKPSKYFKSKNSTSERAKEELVKMGISSDSKVLRKDVEAKDLREERRILAIQKFEAARESAERFSRERMEQRKKLNSGTSQQLKDAILSLESSDNLGIMKLERLLEEKLMKRGADSKDMDVLIFAFDSLAKVYEKKNMKDKAKEAYINAFKLMKKKAPESQGPEWDEAIGQVESMKTTSRSN